MGDQRFHICLKPLDEAFVLFDLLREVFQQVILHLVLLALVVGLHQFQAGHIHIQVHTEGFNQVAAEHPEWKILDSQSGDFTQAGGQQVMESYLKSYPDQFNVVVCQNDNEAYGAIDAMKAAGVTYGVGGDVILISFDATKQGLTLTLEGEINCNVECNPLQAQGVAELIAKLEAGEEVPAVTYVPDSVFVAGGTESELGITMTQEVLDGRAY